MLKLTLWTLLIFSNNKPRGNVSNKRGLSNKGAHVALITQAIWVVVALKVQKQNKTMNDHYSYTSLGGERFLVWTQTG